ncbi:GNAT family N-acetyltransferase [Desulfovermiculus halophilus]|jgi:CelD/BcsL family acetyltransferase involved in cellulose biosynthesis|uniref:GNAT family N-acetyltransferase n=1 Tax=Desulfovermiculus halophilus TaxID=339722 RepID=UPI000487E39C|nr:GNAT family N-acetyltransferase [Desulfovermiculus halophilus]
MAGVRVQHVTTLDEMDSLKDIWKSWEDPHQGAGLFQSWEWCRMWCSHVLAPEQNLRVAIRVMEDGNGRAVGIMPLFSRNMLGSVLQVIDFIGYRMSPQNEVLLAEPNNHDLIQHVAQGLWSSLNWHSFCHLRNLSSESMLCSVLGAQGRIQPQCDRVWVEADPQISDPMQRLSKSRRKRLRHALNSLRKEGDVTVKVASIDEFPAAFDELIVLHKKRFASKNWNTLLCDNKVSFLKYMSMKLAQANKAEILQLRLNEQTIAAQLSFINNETYLAYQVGFDPDYAKYSPMWILNIEAIRRSLYDLMF